MKFLHDGIICFPAMLDAVATAKHEILLEMYWFASDDTGRRFADLLDERARAGVVVRVIYDAVGSLEAEGSMFAAMRTAGCEVLEFNPIAPWKRRFRWAAISRRDHRKQLIVDGRLGITGGLNIGDPWACLEDGGEGWRDDMVQIEGPAVQEMRRVFYDTWCRETNTSLRSALAEVEPANEPAVGGSAVAILANHYRGQHRAIQQAYVRRIRTAKSRVFITNSYFVPDRVIRTELAIAARRGVEVRVMLPGESDLPAVYHAGRRLYGWLLRRGIRIHEWYGSVLHAKSAVIDGQWCTVGTYNLDHRSWKYNLEITAAIEDSEVAAQLEARFKQDLEHTRELKLAEWRYRPLWNRLLEMLFYLFRKWL